MRQVASVWKEGGVTPSVSCEVPSALTPVARDGAMATELVARFTVFELAPPLLKRLSHPGRERGR